MKKKLGEVQKIYGTVKRVKPWITTQHFEELDPSS